jgi:hypothetical protein
MAKRKTSRRKQEQEHIPWNESFQYIHETLLPQWGLQILTEVKLGKLHPRADLAIITPHRGSRRWKKHPLWQFVSKQNILEFKSVHDRIEPGDFEMLLVYSLLYRIKYKIPYSQALSSWLVIPHITPTLRSALKHYGLTLKPLYSGFWVTDMFWPLYIVEYDHLPADTPFASLKIFMQSGKPLQEMLSSVLESEQDESITPLLEAAKLIHPTDLERILEQMRLSEQRERLEKTIEALAQERIEQIRRESELKTVFNMFAEGFDDALISRITGLSIQDIAALRNQ